MSEKILLHRRKADGTELQSWEFKKHGRVFARDSVANGHKQYTTIEFLPDLSVRFMKLGMRGSSRGVFEVQPSRIRAKSITLPSGDILILANRGKA